MKSSFRPLFRLLGCLIIAMFAVSVLSPCFASVDGRHCNGNDVSCESHKASSSDDGVAAKGDAQDHCCAMHISKIPVQAGFSMTSYAERLVLPSYDVPVRITDTLQGLFRPPQA